jgi:hypothetical protein
MEIIQIRNRIDSWDEILTKKQKKYIHFRSMRNFAFYYDAIPNERTRGKILIVLSEYVQEVEDSGFDFNADNSYVLASKYLGKVSDYYKGHLGFFAHIGIGSVIIWGGIADSLLYIVGINSKLGYLPVSTILLTFYYLFVAIFKAPKKKVWGIFY